MELIKETEVSTENGVWRVRIWSDGSLDLIDNHGRQRHISKDHELTGVHLALYMAKHDMPFLPEADVSLQKAAEEYGKKNE